MRANAYVGARIIAIGIGVRKRPFPRENAPENSPVSTFATRFVRLKRSLYTADLKRVARWPTTPFL
jgi:hypothetical protein